MEKQILQSVVSFEKPKTVFVETTRNRGGLEDNRKEKNKIV